LVTLAQVKELMENHLKQEIEVMNQWLQLNENDNKTFVDWYIRHPLRKSLGKIYQDVDARRVGYRTPKDDGLE
jgi:hypothetical protein